MKYFTRELWLAAQEPSATPDLSWQRAFDEYSAHLKGLEARLPAAAYKFFLTADLHDGELLTFKVVDGSRPPKQGEASRPWKTSRSFPVRAELEVLEARGESVWRLAYSLCRRVSLDFPTNKPLFHHEGQGFGDWGYHELTDAGEGFLKHEVLFSSGATLHIEFREFSVESARRNAA